MVLHGREIGTETRIEFMKSCTLCFPRAYQKDAYQEAGGIIFREKILSVLEENATFDSSWQVFYPSISMLRIAGTA